MSQARNVRAAECADQLVKMFADWDPEKAAEAILGALDAQPEGHASGMLAQAAEAAGITGTHEAWRLVAERLYQRARWFRAVEARGKP